MQMWKGCRGKYYWAVLDGRSPLLVEAVPTLLQSRRAIVTSFDCGELHLTDEELRLGWKKNGRAAVSPPLDGEFDIPAAGWGDEWYLFDDSIPDFHDHEVFVSYVGFSPVPKNEHDDTWDVALRRNWTELQDRFWEQLERITPWSYFAYGDFVTFVTQSEQERDAVLKYWAEGFF